MRKIVTSKSFEKDFKRLQKRKYALEKLKTALAELASTGKLDEKYRDHPLRGSYEGCRECHIEPDWLLIYIIHNDTLELARTGTHSDLFKE